MLSLREFVRDAIVELAGAVNEARPLVEAAGGVLAPSKFYGRIDLVPCVTDHSGRTITFVEFDLAVTVAEESGSSSKVGVVAGVFGAGLTGSDKATSTGVSRIQFRVPMVLP